MKTVDQWLAYQQHLHPHAIEMGLDRVREVWQRMGASRPAPVVITVGGTNGKGSTVAFLEAMLQAGGMRVGAYTSPHILRYNERVHVDGLAVDDADLVAAFERVEAARSEVALTYFEFGTLGAFDVFAHAGLDVAVLEVGLGGRLDAVNIIDADCAIVVTVDLDHMEYLGPDRESIGREKAGIFRAGRPAIAGEAEPPQTLVGHASDLGARLEVFDRDFGWEAGPDGLHWWHREAAGGHCGACPDACVAAVDGLALEGAFQYRNAAAAIAALHALGARVRWDPRALRRDRDAAAPVAMLAGRLQHLGNRPDVVVDVGHNPQAARMLASWLDAHPVSGRTLAVFGALADKDVEGVVAALGARIDHWFIAGLTGESPRGETADRLQARLQAALPAATCTACIDIAAALAKARGAAGADDRILAFGSFHVVAPVLRVPRV